MVPLRVFAIAVLLVCTPATMMGGVAAIGGEAPEITAQTAVDNETDVHRDPGTVDEDGDAVAVEMWLTNRLGDLLTESSAELGDGEYDDATASLEEYQFRVEQLADVSEAAGADERVALFEQLGTEQETLIDQLEEYEALEAEYESAREAGDDDRARELARELGEQRNTIEETTQTVDETSREVSTETGIDTRESREMLETTEEEIDDDVGEIRTEEFEETELTIDADENISFLEPLEAEGTVTTTDGEPIDDDEIQVLVEDEVIETELEDGEFEFEYQPVDLPLGTESLQVAYVPATDSPYTSSETTVPVSIEQVEPNLTVSEVPTTLAYEDNGTIDAELEVDGDAVNDVPIDATLNRTGTDESIELDDNVTTNGSATIEYTVPADVPEDEYDLVVEVPLQEHVIASTASRESVVVAETDTELEIDQVAREADRELAVSGTFLTADGEVIRGQPIEVFVGGVSVGTAVTDQNGAFDEVVPVPDGVESGEVEVTGVYDGEGTNLENATATSAVAVPRDGFIGIPMTLELWVGLGIFAAIGLFVSRHLFRRRNHRKGRTDSEWDPLSSADVERVPETIEPLLLRASAQLSNDRPDDAVRTCYNAVRNALTGRIGARRSITPRELLRTVEDAGLVTHTERLQTVIDGHERAAYRPTNVSAAEARTVLELAVDLCEGDESEQSTLAEGLADSE